MLSKEENEFLTRVGAGTPAGEMLRRYWWPVAFSDAVKSQAAPIKVTLLAEDFALFRDGEGQVSAWLRCTVPIAARRWNLAGSKTTVIRCCYHGWLWDVRGNCLEQPAEPADSTFKERVKHPAYHAQDAGGLIFAYVGPRAGAAACRITICSCATMAAAWSVAARSFAIGCSARRIPPTALIRSRCMPPAIRTWR